jgi:hypothetical protein
LKTTYGVFYIEKLEIKKNDDTFFALISYALGVRELVNAHQSIAPAQSIAHGQIGDSISQKNLIFEKLFFTKVKNGKFSSRFLKKILQF